MHVQELKKFVFDWIEANKQEFHDISDQLFNHPELGMEEYEASATLSALLEKHGFTVERGVADMPTAFIATYGQAGPVCGFNAEYDALPGLSQEAWNAIKTPVIEGAPGQGCGHNLIGVTAILAAIATRYALEQAGEQAILKVFGTPAEELCLGKAFMARAGCFNGVDFFIDWHPMFDHRANYDHANAYFSLKYHFKGQSSHGNRPWYGRSALDAAILMGHALEMLREHYPPAPSVAGANTLNYTFSDVGPEFASVVPDHSTLWCVGRFYTTEELVEVMERVDKCAEAGALATGTTMEKEFICATHEKIPNKVLAEVIHKNLSEIGPLPFTAEEQAFAKSLQRAAGVPEDGLQQEILPCEGGDTFVSDISEYSWHAPHAFFLIPLAPTCAWHNWMMVACAGGSLGNKNIDYGSKIIAASVLDVLAQPELIEKAKAELAKRLHGRTYSSLIPAEVDPPVAINKATMDKYRPQYK